MLEREREEAALKAAINRLFADEADALRHFQYYKAAKKTPLNTWADALREAGWENEESLPRVDSILQYLECVDEIREAEADAEGNIRSEFEDLSDHLRELDMHPFPVVLTNASKPLLEGDYDGIVVFGAEELWSYTKHLGVLRMHTEKLGRPLADLGPVLNRAALLPLDLPKLPICFTS